MVAAPTAAIAIVADATGRDRIMLTVISLMPTPPAPPRGCPYGPRLQLSDTRPERVGGVSPLAPRRYDRAGQAPVAELVDAPDSKFVEGCPDPFRPFPTSVDLLCENRPHVPFRPVRSWLV